MKDFSFLYVHPPISCSGNQLEPVIEKTITAVSLGEANTFAKETTVIGICGHTYELAAKPH